MKVKRTYAGFTGEIDVGRFAFFIVLDDDGVHVEIEHLLKQVVHFPRVVITGVEPFTQKEEIAKLIRRTKTKKSDVIFDIHTTGTIRPVQIGTFDNIVYNVNVQLKRNGGNYTDRIKDTILHWFNQMEANFKFYVNTQDDVDEANMIITALGINKKQVYLAIDKEASQEHLQLIIQNAKIHGYNFTLNYGYMFWRKDNNGRND